MQRPQHMTDTASRYTPERIAGIAFVAVLHIALIYALAAGLAQRFVQNLPHELTAQVLPQKVEEPKVAPPPPAQLQKPTLPQVTPPEIVVNTPAPAPAISVQMTPHPAASAPQPVIQSPISTVAKGITATHTIPPYPEMERRLGHEGTVTLTISIDANGQITDAQVANSSGSQALDQAAVEWVKSHWKYKPAIQNGTPVASTAQAAVQFSLKNAH